MRLGGRFTMAWLLLLGADFSGGLSYSRYPAICCYLCCDKNGLDYGKSWGFPSADDTLGSILCNLGTIEGVEKQQQQQEIRSSLFILSQSNMRMPIPPVFPFQSSAATSELYLTLPYPSYLIPCSGQDSINPSIHLIQSSKPHTLLYIHK